MVLKEKFETTMILFLIDRNQDSTMLDHFEKLTDEFAIEFHQWMRVNDTQENSEKYFHFTDKDMLNEFKKEKGL